MTLSVPRSWVARIRDILNPDERVEAAITEHRLASPKPFATATIYCTNERIIIVRRHFLGMGRSYKILHYNSISHITVERGMRYSKIHLGISGEAPESGEEWKRWVWGLDQREVNQIAGFMDTKKKGIKIEEETGPGKA